MPNPITSLNAALEGRYRIERELGEGGMAIVYLADDLKHDRSVALKVLKPGLAAVIGVERFLAEIKTTANLQHPRILPLFDSGEADGFLYYVMPYVEGETLRDRLDREGSIGIEDALSIAREAAQALDYAHAHGVIHRDVKPENILLGEGGAVVADFGIALAISEAGGKRLTEAGLSLGTPTYMSPEQAAGDSEVTPTSDVYSLACVVHEMLASTRCLRGNRRFPVRPCNPYWPRLSPNPRLQFAPFSRPYPRTSRRRSSGGSRSNQTNGSIPQGSLLAHSIQRLRSLPSKRAGPHALCELSSALPPFWCCSSGW
jgi:serine/threonine-protein kinase